MAGRGAAGEIRNLAVPPLCSRLDRPAPRPAGDVAAAK
jgi:hypothetical protein